MKRKLRVAFLGSGKIGIDLLIKAMRSNLLECVLVSGRNLESDGLKKSKSLGIPISDQGINSILNQKEDIDLVFDATSAMAHKEHWNSLQETNIRVIDMTPSGIGLPVVPAINSKEILNHQNVNMITCGGQASLPIVHAVSKAQEGIHYIEIVSSIASKSAGPATRANIDEYIEATENGAKRFSNTTNSKVILILNPAEPPIFMQTSISFLTKGFKINLDKIKESTNNMISDIKKYVPGYELLVEPVIVGDDRLIVMIKVTGLGDYLPSYAGNLDIINCAAISVAESFSKSR